MGSVVAILVGLAPMFADGATRHGHRLAPESFRLVLDTSPIPATRGLAGLRGQANSADTSVRVLSPHGRLLSGVLVNLAGQKHRHLRAPRDLSE
jgi:hypothetical protein